MYLTLFTGPLLTTRNLMLLFVGPLLLCCLIVVCIIFILICFRRRIPEKVTIINAQRSYIIKKRVILEAPTFDTSIAGSDLQSNFDKELSCSYLAPLVKIDCKTVSVDMNSEELSKWVAKWGGGTQYELPLDPNWEMDRNL